MKVCIKIETEFGWGEKRSHQLCTVERRAIDATEEDLGLSLAEGKSLLKQIQRALLQDQIEEVSEVARVCRFCGTYLVACDFTQLERLEPIRSSGSPAERLDWHPVLTS